MVSCTEVDEDSTRGSLQRMLMQNDGDSLLDVVEKWVVLHQGRSVMSVHDIVYLP